MHLPKETHTLVPRTIHVTLYDKRDFVDVITVVWEVHQRNSTAGY